MIGFSRFGRVIAFVVIAGSGVVVLGSRSAEAAPLTARSATGGVLQIDAGNCGSDAAPTGSYLRMVLPSGTVSGPFLSNGDSSCGDQSFTPLAPGIEGGLTIGDYQSEPSPGFDGSGNSLAKWVIAPARFYGVAFGVSTNPTDPQTGIAVAAPTIDVGADGALTGDLRSFAVSWNQQEFNQGAPKPDGSAPGNTTAAHGSLDGSTGRFSLDWASQVEGGPFDHFTGVWHLEGRLASISASGTTANGVAPSGGATSNGPTGGPTAEGAATPGVVANGDPAPTGASDAQLSTQVPRAARPVQAATSTVGATSHHGNAPSWLVVMTAAIGLIGLASFLLLDRLVRAGASP